MSKRLLKKVIIRDHLKGDIPIKWIIEYWLTNAQDGTSMVLTVITAKYLMPAPIANKIKGSEPLRRFKDKVLIKKDITMPEIVLSVIGIQAPNQMEIQKILSSGGVQILRQKKK